MSLKLHPVENVYDGIFNTASGKQINLLDPKPEQICLHDIAKGLSNICRFGGQLEHFQSVAKHTLLVWYLAPPRLKRAALLHDASEAYLGDIIKPLKVLIQDIYGPFEDRFTEVIFKKYHVNIDLLNELKPYDLGALNIEHTYHRKSSKEYLEIFTWIDDLIGQATPYVQLMKLFKQEFGMYER